MTQSLVVNGKEYLPSNVLASRFEYTPDYIGKLAREEKILGTQVGRVWFIEPESLKTFLAQAEVEKKLRADDLRTKRKLEREVHEKSQQEKVRAEREHEFIAVAQAAVVVLCAGLLGALGFVSTEAELSVAEFAYGVESNVAHIASSIFPRAEMEEARVEEVVVPALTASTLEANRYQAAEVRDEELIFTTLPIFPVREPITGSSSTSTVSDLLMDFSDEVRIVTHEDGSQVITPVFRKGEGSEFLLTPVNAHIE